MSYLILVPLLPLLTAIIAFREQGVKAGVLPIIAALIGSIVTLVMVSLHGPITVLFYEPGSIANLAFPIGFHIDRLSAVMMVLISTVATVLYFYCKRYMFQEQGYARYLALLGFTIFVLLCMVSSANLMMLFLFWQILSWLLYLLAQNLSHAATLSGAFKTFTMLRIGDVAFLAGIALAYSLYGTIEFQELFDRAAANPITLSLWLGFEMSGPTAVALLIFIGAMSKSVQFPLHIWLPSSLYAPTPAHALLHAGIINAGGFLMNRLAPLYGLSPATLHVAFVIGALTAVLGASMMLAQNDIKKTLGFSTIGQMGFMIMECGLGAFSFAVFHLIAHGLFKGTIFLSCGDVIHKARENPSFPHQGHGEKAGKFSRLTWYTGFFATLLIPLIILLVIHDMLDIQLVGGSQGTIIFLFFIWVTSSQAILTLTRWHGVASWKVSVAMLLALFVVMFTYLFAVESFTHFLYPAPGEAAFYFQAAALPDWLFSGIIITVAILISLTWIYLYASTREKNMWAPAWVETLRTRLYVLLMNRLYLDELYQKLGQALMRVAHRLEKLTGGRSS